MKVFDSLDGVQPGLAHFNTSARTPDGRLWFANGDVLQEIDPAQLPLNLLAPPVTISRLVADRKAYPLQSIIYSLPALTPRRREIDYSGLLSYVIPAKGSLSLPTPREGSGLAGAWDSSASVLQRSSSGAIPVSCDRLQQR